MRYTPSNTVLSCRPVRVFLDGTEVPRALEADDEAGYVVWQCPGPDGKPFLDAGGNIATARLDGEVRVEPIAP